MNIRQLAHRVDPGIGPPALGPPLSRPSSGLEEGANFAEALRRANDEIRLSAHAQQRISQRGIAFGEIEQQSIREALQLLESKGALDALLLRNDAAFIVNVPSKTVVTAMDQQELRQRVFTQIDSAVLI